MRTAIVQFAASLEPAENLVKIRELLADLTAGDVDLVVLPEAAMCDFGSPHVDLTEASQTLDGPFVRFLSEEAQRLEAHIVAGMFETHKDKPFNTVVTVNPTGTLTDYYRKIHLFDSFGYSESDRFTTGPLEPTTVTIADQTWGIITCYDLRFPELGRALIAAGAQGFIVPAAWLAGPNKTMQWETLLRARAIENVCPVIAVGQSGPNYCGHSQVIGALGERMAAVENEPTLLLVDVDPAQTIAAREKNPALDHRRL